MATHVEQKVGYLSTMDVFRDLSAEDLQMMERQVTMATCKPGKIFYMPDDMGQVLFLLKKGRVQLYRISPSGKKLIVATLGAGAIFGEMALVGQRMHRTFAESVDECLICVMSRADVERLVREKPKVALRFLESMGERLSQMEYRLEEIAFKSIPARLAGLLLRLCGEQGSEFEVSGYTHQDLGEMLGTYRETTTQTLNEFKSDGLIEIGRKRIRLLNSERLVEIAEA